MVSITAGKKKSKGGILFAAVRAAPWSARTFVGAFESAPQVRGAFQSGADARGGLTAKEHTERKGIGHHVPCATSRLA